MSSHFCLSVTFHHASFHGRRDDAVPEWPPSPLRAFQALVAAAACRREPHFDNSVISALEWLEGLDPPEIIAPIGRTTRFAYRLYVPNNAGDLVSKLWAAGNTDASIAAHRTGKDFRPTHLVGGDAFSGGNTVRFLWRIPVSASEGTSKFIDSLSAAARRLTHLGWGIDMAAGHAKVVGEHEVSELLSDKRLVCWTPGIVGTSLRVPKPQVGPRSGTLQSLVSRHESFTRRMTGGKPQDVPPLSSFQVVSYRRSTDPPQRQFAAFSLLKPDASGMRSFDTTRRTREVAGMLRSAVARVARGQGWSDERINVFVHGKTPDGRHPASGEESPDRFQYIPLATINSKLGRAESIRRVLIAAPAHCGQQIAWVRRTLAGEELKNENDDSVALVTILPGSDWVLKQYVGSSRFWSTVTPVILPGYDDGNLEKAGRLLKTAFLQAGYQEELLNQTELEWRRVGFRAGVDLASRYLPPENINHRPQYHVLVTFPHPIHGPLVVGSGRFRGFGLFASQPSS